MANPQKRRYREIRDSFDEKKELVNQQISKLNDEYRKIEKELNQSDDALKPLQEKLKSLKEIKRNSALLLKTKKRKYATFKQVYMSVSASLENISTSLDEMKKERAAYKASSQKEMNEINISLKECEAELESLDKAFNEQLDKEGIAHFTEEGASSTDAKVYFSVVNPINNSKAEAEILLAFLSEDKQWELNGKPEVIFSGGIIEAVSSDVKVKNDIENGFTMFIDLDVDLTDTEIQTTESVSTSRANTSELSNSFGSSQSMNTSVGQSVTNESSNSTETGSSNTNETHGSASLGYSTTAGVEGGVPGFGSAKLETTVSGNLEYGESQSNTTSSSMTNSSSNSNSISTNKDVGLERNTSFSNTNSTSTERSKSKEFSVSNNFDPKRKFRLQYQCINDNGTLSISHVGGERQDEISLQAAVFKMNIDDTELLKGIK